MGTATSKQPLTFRVAPATRKHLKRRAVESGESQTALAERYLEEGLRRDEHPLIWFRDGAAAYLDQPAVKIRAAMRYYAAYEDEVDAWAERVRAIAEREEAVWLVPKG